MQTIGVRELHTHTAEVLRQVREDGVEYVITDEGAPVARLMPIAHEAVAMAQQSAASAWEAFDQLMQELRSQWSDPRSTQEIMDEERGD